MTPVITDIAPSPLHALDARLQELGIKRIGGSFNHGGYTQTLVFQDPDTHRYFYGHGSGRTLHEAYEAALDNAERIR